MKHKNAPATLAPEPVDESGVFEAIVSVFNNKDLAGDIVRPGAFIDSLDTWKSQSTPIPVYWSHRMDDPMFNIGEVVEAREIGGGDSSVPDWAGDWIKANGGLYVKAKLDEYGMGEHVGRLLKSRRVTQFSFSYDVLDERKAKDGTNELLQLWLHEVGPTPLGCNPMTELLAAKARAIRDAESDPPQPEPPQASQAPPKRRPPALFLRLQAELALAELAD